MNRQVVARASRPRCRARGRDARATISPLAGSWSLEHVWNLSHNLRKERGVHAASAFACRIRPEITRLASV